MQPNIKIIKKINFMSLVASALLVAICFLNLSCGKFAGSISKYVAPKTYVYAGTSTGGLSISSDGGGSWITTTAGTNGFASNNNVQSVFAIGQNIYAATFGGGLSISSDYGISWVTTISGANGFAPSNSVHPFLPTVG
jgi:hypothetical protein